MAIDLDSAIFISQVSAVIAAVSLVACQTDTVSRKILSPLRLYAKRRKEQFHKLDNAIADSVLSIRTHVNEGNNFEASAEKSVTELILNDSSIQRIVDEIVHEQKDTKNVAPLIVAIAKDLTIPKNQLYAYLAYPETGSYQADGISPRYNRRVQVPLVAFCTKLASAFEKKLTSNTLCFIADASSSLSSEFLSKLFTNCQRQLGIPLVQEPAWMTTTALLTRQKVLSEDETERILFAFCRLEAYKLELENKVGKQHKTVVFILPGQSSTKAMLPILQNKFPCERHVFAYDGCVSSVQRAMMLLKQRKQETLYNATFPISTMSRSISSTIPIILMQNILEKLPSLLTSLSNDMAGAVEAWISSVDTLIQLKDNERSNGYTPFVCRMDFMFNTLNENDEKRSLALTNILQYITGSRALNEGVVDAAQSVMMDVIEESQNNLNIYPNVSHEDRIAIESCVFAHKMILIGDKSLPDTVIPKKEWSLKSAKK